MNTKDDKENVSGHQEFTNEESRRLRTKSKIRHNNYLRKVNGLWIWLAVLVLIFILLWWLYTIGTFEALSGAING